jgi:membrane associated rhomboid family serine protease
MTRWVTRLLIANVMVFLAQQAFDPYVTNWLIFRAADVLRYPWTIFTYMFLHAGVWHLFFNMLSLYFFGPAVETRLGSRNFLALYLVSGLTGAAFSFFTPLAQILGASAAVFGVMLAFARYWPREKIYIWGVIPLEAWMLIAIMTLMSVFGIGKGIAHFAHLGGFAGAFVYIKWMEWRSPARAFKRKVQGVERVFTSDAGAVKRWERINIDQLHPINRSEVERLLAKVKSTGISSLSPDERATLDRFSTS